MDCPVVKVKFDNEQGYYLLNESDFDETKHELFIEEEDKPAEDKPAEEGGKVKEQEEGKTAEEEGKPAEGKPAKTPWAKKSK
jgi:hypothetical protein